MRPGLIVWGTLQTHTNNSVRLHNKYYIILYFIEKKKKEKKTRILKIIIKIIKFAISPSHLKNDEQQVGRSGP
jgi:hypothetical protein